jgi:hypothetical protein
MIVVDASALLEALYILRPADLGGLPPVARRAERRRAVLDDDERYVYAIAL